MTQDVLPGTTGPRHEWLVFNGSHGYPIDEKGERLGTPWPIEASTVVRKLRSGDQFTRIRFIHQGREFDVDNEDVEGLDINQQFKRENTPNRICVTCLRLLPNEEFPYDNERSKGKGNERQRRPECHVCRAHRTKRKVRLTPDQEAKRPMHGNEFTCPVCEHTYIAGVTCRVVADHDHDTGVFRDFICGDRCNSAMGRFRNGSDNMWRAVEYLRRHGAVR